MLTDMPIVEEKIREWIKKFIEGRNNELWRQPIIGFSDARDRMFSKLRKVVSENHLIPEEAFSPARSVIVYFIPFSRKVVESNIQGRYSSRLWAEAYLETNKLIVDLNNYIARKLELNGYSSLVLPPTHNFDEHRLVSDWSHKHVAYISGIGTFGKHTLLITESGCCGRLGSLITQAELEPNERIEDEYCLWKNEEGCLACVKRCRFGALTEDGFDRRRCYSICLENDAFHSDLPLTDVCGKCACGVPCSMQNPLKG